MEKIDGLSMNEIKLMRYLFHSEENRTNKSLDEISSDLKWSRRKLQYTIESLVDLGLVEKKYTLFKRLIFKV